MIPQITVPACYFQYNLNIAQEVRKFVFSQKCLMTEQYGTLFFFIGSTP